MAVYGKPKKKSLFTSFSVLRDFESTSDSSTSKSGKQESINQRLFSSRHNDSIEEMASMLLEDSSGDQPKMQPAKRSLPKPTVKASAAPRHKQLLKRSPSSSLLQDDTRIAISSNLRTTSGSSSKALRLYGEAGLTDEDENLLIIEATNYSRETSAPPIPQRSSKTMSTKPTDMGSVGQALFRDRGTLQARSLENTSFRKTSSAHVATNPTARDGNIILKSKITIKSSQALSSHTDGKLLHGPLAGTGKQQHKNSSVVRKVRTAIKDHLLVRSSKTLHDPVRDDNLLDCSGVNDDQFPNEERSTPSSNLTATEIRSNEGLDFMNPKNINITGQGVVRRKPLPQEKTSKEQKIEASHSASEPPIRTPTRLQLRDEYDASKENNLDSYYELPIRSHNMKNKMPQNPKSTKSPARYEVEFDAQFSSSPLAQSTPRIRLEPTFEEDGRKTLQNVPSESRSLFDLERASNGLDSNMELLDSESEKKAIHAERFKRKNSQIKESSIAAKKHNSKRVKKHPSPSKAELEVFENTLRLYPHSAGSGSLATREESASTKPTNKVRSNRALTSKDANSNVYSLEAGPRGFKKGSEVPAKLLLSRTIKSVTETSKGSKGAQKSMIPRKAKPSHSKWELEAQECRPYSARTDQVEDSLMDIDELQWEQTTYHIGMRRV